MRAIVTAIALAMISTTALAADQFDLDCKGTMEGFPTHQIKDDHEVFSIDLRRSEWCNRTDGCKTNVPFAEVTPSRLTLYAHSEGTIGNIGLVDRVTGEMTLLNVAGGGLGAVERLKCVVAPFTPMPTAQF